MSLAEAVLEIAEDMEKLAGDDRSAHSTDGEHDRLCGFIADFAKQLRRVVKASGPTKPTSFGWDVNVDPKTGDKKLVVPTDPEMEMFLQTQAAEGMGKLKETTSTEERLGERSVWTVGGPADNTLIVIPPDMPDRAWKPLEGGWYRLEGNQLVYNEEATNKMKEAKGG